MEKLGICVKCGKYVYTKFKGKQRRWIINLEGVYHLSCFKLSRMPKEDKLAEQHVDWFLKIIRPLLIEFFKHGGKHEREDEKRR